MVQAMTMFMTARENEFDVSENISSLCAERQAYRLAGMFGPEASRCRYEAKSMFDDRARNVVYDESHLACDYKGLGKFSDVYAFESDGSLTPACLYSGKPVPNTVTGPVDVKDPVFQRTLYDLGWPEDVISGLNTQQDVVDNYKSNSFLQALSDTRVPFGESRAVRTAMAMKLVPEIERLDCLDYGQSYAAGFGIRIPAVEDIHDFDDGEIASKMIGHLDVPLGETEREVLTKSGVFPLVELPVEKAELVVPSSRLGSSGRDMRDLDAACDDILGASNMNRQVSDDMDF